MSSIVARVVFGVACGVVAAVIYAYRNRLENTAHGHGSRPRMPSRSRREDEDYEPRNKWRDDYDEDEDEGSNRAKKRTKLSSSNSTSTNSDIVKKCGICLEYFAELKKKGVEIHSTPCGHLFCISCLKTLRKVPRDNRGNNEIPRCPECRVIIRSDQSTLRIYI